MAQLGSAFALGAKGREFESPHSDVAKTRSWTDDELRKATAESVSYLEMMRKLGLKGNSRRTVNTAIARLNVDVSHFRRWRKASDQDLTEAVQQCHSMAEVLDRLGLKYAGGTHALYANRIKRLGLDISHFRGHGSPPERANKLSDDEILIYDPDRVYRVPRYQLKRSMISKGMPYRCAVCEQDPEWQGRPLTLEIDHKDGNRWNNRLENLQFLCPNCHTQTESYANYRKPGRVA